MYALLILSKPLVFINKALKSLFSFVHFIKLEMSFLLVRVFPILVKHAKLKALLTSFRPN